MMGAVGALYNGPAKPGWIVTSPGLGREPVDSPAWSTLDSLPFSSLLRRAFGLGHHRAAPTTAVFVPRGDVVAFALMILVPRPAFGAASCSADV